MLEPKWRPLTRVFVESLLLGAFCVWGLNVCDPSDPCNNENAVFLPQSAQCLVPIKNAKDWIRAEATCEESGGSLYRLEAGKGDLLPDPRVQLCMSALGAGEQEGQDYWIGTASVWSRQWMWVNGTLLNPIRYVTKDDNAFATSQPKVPVCSRYLSVDYCVSVCHDAAAAYTILHRQNGYPCCFCSFRLDKRRVEVSNDSYFDPDRVSYYIAVSREDQGSLIRLVGSETFSETETMCATVDTNTYSRRELRSQTCFSKSPFLCSLGTDPAQPCETTNCEQDQCRFRIRDECVQRDSRPLTWFRARSECQAMEGDLWTVSKLNDMYQASRYLQTDTVYWVGATDHVRSYVPESRIFGNRDPDYEVVRCGHMFLERSKVGAHAGQWKWADSRCDQHKSYICQFKQTTYTSLDTDKTVICPWPIPTDSPATSTSASSSASRTTVSSARAGVQDSSSVPVVAIVAACIAALVILLCAIFVLAYSRRRKWLVKRWRRARERFWPQWVTAARPTYLSADHSSEQGFADSFSTGFPGVHSETGSVFIPGSPVFPDPSHPDGSAYKNHGHAQKARSKDGSRKNEALENLRERLQGHVAASSSRKDDEDSVRAGNLEGSGFHTLGSISEERLLSTSYASVASGTARDYMTLSAHMNIRDDDAETPNHSLRMKPEVALVTGDVDLHLTVNHAYSRNQQGVERFVDEIDLPMTPTVQIPTRRAVEDSVLHL